MIYILASNFTLESRTRGKLSSLDSLIVSLAMSPKSQVSSVISNRGIQTMVDTNQLPESKNDIILAFDCNAKLVGNLKRLAAKGWRIINDPQVSLDLRNNLRTIKKVAEQGIVPVRKFHETHFPIYEDKYVRPRPPIEGSIRSYFSTIESPPQQFVVVPKYNLARWRENNIPFQGHIVEDIDSFDWSEIDAREQIYIIAEGIPSLTIRVPIIGGSAVLESATAINSPFIENYKATSNYDVKSNYPEIENYCVHLAEITGLKIGYFDFQIVNGKVEFVQGNNFLQDFLNPTKIEPMIAAYVKSLLN